MPVAWRLVKERHAPTAFSGEGAARTGGRWNSRGQHVVYASATQSLAVLESLVHLDTPIVFRYAILRLEFPDSLIEKIVFNALPKDWRNEPPPNSTKKMGDFWMKENRSAVLAVPSVLVPEETNYLLNPRHPDFLKIKIGAAAPFSFDPRLRS